MDDRVDASPDGIFVMLRVPPAIAAQFPPETVEPHVTLLHAGDGPTELWQRVALLVADEAGARWANLHFQRTGDWVHPFDDEVRLLGDVEYFDKDEDRVAWVNVSLGERVKAFRQNLLSIVRDVLGHEPEHADSWTPHATLARIPKGERWTGAVPVGAWKVGHVEVWRGPDQRLIIGRRSVWKVERVDGRWTAGRAAGTKPLQGTFATVDEAIAALEAAAIEETLAIDRLDERPRAPAVRTQPRTTHDAWRRDSAELHQPVQLPSGWWAFDATCAKAGNTQVYYENGREVVEYRPPEVVFDKRSLATAPGIPWELLHSAKLLTPDTVLNQARGCMLDYGVHEDGIHTRGTLVAWDRTLLDSILLEEGAEGYGPCRQTSMAYQAAVRDEPGTTDYGVHFDRYVTAIVYNTIANVPEGRAGTTRLGTPHADAAGRPKDFQFVSHADALLQIARAGKLPSKPIYFSRASWRPTKDETPVPTNPLIDAILTNAGKTMADLAVAMGVTADELAAMLASDLTPEQVNQLATALSTLGAKVELEVEADMAKKPKDEMPPAADEAMVDVDVDGKTYSVPAPVAALLEQLRSTAGSAAGRADAAERRAKAAETSAEQRLKGMISHADAIQMVAAEAGELAELVALTRQIRGVGYMPAPRQDAAGKERPLSRRDWQAELLLAHYGDVDGKAKVEKLDSLRSEEGRAEVFAHMRDAVVEDLKLKASTLETVKTRLGSMVGARAQSDAAPPSDPIADAKARAAEAAAGRSVTTN